MRSRLPNKVVSGWLNASRKMTRAISVGPSTFAHHQLYPHERSSRKDKASWSGTLSFSAPESDFVGMVARSEGTVPSREWSGTLSYTSPEADFVAPRLDLYEPESISKASDTVLPEFLLSKPETALGHIHSSELLDSSSRDEILRQMGLPLSETKSIPLNNPKIFDSLGFMSSPETAAGYIHVAELLSPEELAKVELTGPIHASLPDTMEAALADPRAVVVTAASSPFDVVEVNDAWVGLCGYDREEAVHKNLGSLLQGPETNTRDAQDLIARLKKDQYGEAVITNYTKDGRKFQNHVKVGVLSEPDSDAIKYFVGVLEEISESGRSKMSM